MRVIKQQHYFFTLVTAFHLFVCLQYRPFVHSSIVPMFLLILTIIQQAKQNTFHHNYCLWFPLFNNFSTLDIFQLSSYNDHGLLVANPYKFRTPVSKQISYSLNCLICGSIVFVGYLVKYLLAGYSFFVFSIFVDCCSIFSIDHLFPSFNHSDFPKLC